jgi:cytochrome P450
VSSVCPQPDVCSLPFAPGRQDGPPHEFLRRVAGEPAGRVRMPSGELAGLVVGYDDVRTVLSDPRFTRDIAAWPATPPYYPGEDPSTADPDFLANMPAARHKQVRRIVAKAFSAVETARWRPSVERIAGELATELAATLKAGAGGDVDFVGEFAFRFTMGVMMSVLDMPMRDRARFSGFTTAAAATRLAEFTAYVDGLVALRRAEPADSIVDRLIAACDGEERLTDRELVHLVLSMIIAGHETTASTLSRGVHALLLAPERWAALAADPDLAPAYAEEILRRHPAVEISLIRVATEDVVLPSGATFRRGEPVLAGLQGANLDPAFFPEGSSFAPAPAGAKHRHLSFGHGAHHCLGAGLARLELEVALSTLATVLPDLRLAAGSRQPVTHNDGFVRGLPDLPVRLLS